VSVRSVDDQIQPDDVDVFEDLRPRLGAIAYRLLGSAAEAEDLVQETFLRAWKASASFQGRSSVRTWLYRIATNVCLTNLEGRPRRPLPAGLGTPDQMAGDALEENHEIAWLEPVPDVDGVWVEIRDSARGADDGALRQALAQAVGSVLSSEREAAHVAAELSDRYEEIDHAVTLGNDRVLVLARALEALDVVAHTLRLDAMFELESQDLARSRAVVDFTPAPGFPQREPDIEHLKQMHDRGSQHCVA